MRNPIQSIANVLTTKRNARAYYWNTSARDWAQMAREATKNGEHEEATQCAERATKARARAAQCETSPLALVALVLLAALFASSK